MTAVIQVKRGTAAAWTSANTVLAAGEIGFETDTKKMKVGDGSTAWTSLGYTATDGDISGVTAGTGLSGGGNSGAVTLNLSTPVAATNGGTAQTTYATGDLLYASAADTLAKRTIGTTGQVLTVSGGVPAWTSPASTTPTFTGCLASGVTQVLSSGTETIVAFTNTDYYDTNAFHDTSTNPGRITIPAGKGGYYLMYGNVPWQTGSPNTRQVRLYKNGSEMRQVYTFGETTGYYYTQQFTTVVSAVAGDYFEIRATHQNGSNLRIYGESGDGSLPGLTFGCALIGV